MLVLLDSFWSTGQTSAVLVQSSEQFEMQFKTMLSMNLYHPLNSREKFKDKALLHSI